MPELPEVETVMTGLSPVLTGSTILQATQSCKQLRFPLPDDFTLRLQGRKILKLTRRAKYILVHMSGNEILLIHLGMSGSFRMMRADAPAKETSKPLAARAFVYPRGALQKHDHIILHLDTGYDVIFNDPRRFGMMDLVAETALASHGLLCDLGVEPLSEDLTPAHLAANFLHKSISLKAALLDQHNIAGLGNIYVCEALYAAHLSPLREASTLVGANGQPTKALKILVQAIKTVLTKAIAAGGSSLRDHKQPNGALGYFQHQFQVYGRAGQPCLTHGCNGHVLRSVQNGRSSFYCKVCQR